MKTKPKIIIDIDGTLCSLKKKKESYSSLKPNVKVLRTLRFYKKKGFYIVLYTARNMKSFQGNMGLINAVTAPLLLSWLKRYRIPFDEIHYGKPWSGLDGFYVDDRVVRPKEFCNYSYKKILGILNESNE